MAHTAGSVNFARRGGICSHVNCNPCYDGDDNTQHWKVIDNVIIFAEEPGPGFFNVPCILFSCFAFCSNYLELNLFGIEFIKFDEQVNCNIYNKHIFNEDKVITCQNVTEIKLNILRSEEKHAIDNKYSIAHVNFIISYETSAGVFCHISTRELRRHLTKYEIKNHFESNECEPFVAAVNEMIKQVKSTSQNVGKDNRNQFSTSHAERSHLSWTAKDIVPPTNYHSIKDEQAELEANARLAAILEQNPAAQDSSRQPESVRTHNFESSSRSAGESVVGLSSESERDGAAGDSQINSQLSFSGSHQGGKFPPKRHEQDPGHTTIQEEGAAGGEIEISHEMSFGGSHHGGKYHSIEHQQERDEHHLGSASHNLGGGVAPAPVLITSSGISSSPDTLQPNETLHSYTAIKEDDTTEEVVKKVEDIKESKVLV